MDSSSLVEPVENLGPLTEAEYFEGLLMSIFVGAFYTLNAFLPIIAWFGWKKADIQALSGMFFYKLAWRTMITTHWIVFLPMALIWPMTYLGNEVILDFYTLANWYIGNVASGFVFSGVAIVWLMAWIFYTSGTSYIQ